MATMTREEIVASSTMRHREAFGWLLSGERKVLRFILEQALNEAKPMPLSRLAYQDAKRILKNLEAWND